MDGNSNKPIWIIAGVLVVAAAISSQCSEKQASEAQPTSNTPSAASGATQPTTPRSASANVRLEECRAKLKAAVPLDLVTNMSYDDGRPKLWVGPTWHKINIDAKEGLAREAACFFLAGDETKAITFPIYDGMTGKEIATWKFSRLEVE